MRIHILRGSQQQEFSLKDVNAMLGRGELNGEEHAWTPGLDDWTLLKMVEGVIVPIPPAPPPDPLRDFSPPFRPNSTQTVLTPNAEPASETRALPTIPTLGPKGIGGWLLFHCVGLTILGPLLTFGSMSSNWVQAKPAFETYPSLESAMYTENIGIGVIAIAGFIAGIWIWSGRPDGRKIAQTYLKGRLLGFIGIEVLAYILISNLSSDITQLFMGEVLKAIFREVVFFSIWWAYFKKSKRVRNTYGP